MRVKEYLQDIPGVRYFIVDSHQGSKGLNKNEYFETDFNTYEYKLSSNKKIQTGSVFLYRRPGTSSKQQFNIYGGGVFGEIEKEGDNTISYETIQDKVGLIFCLHDFETIELLKSLSEEYSKYLSYSDIAGIKQVQFTSELDSNTILDNYYGSNI